MKKTYISIAVVVFGLTGCKKDYSCTCYDHFDNVVSTTKVQAKSTEEALIECGKDINYGEQSYCSVD